METKKILAVIGSPNGATSNTVAFANDFMESVKSFVGGSIAVETEVVSLGKVNIGPCKGCWACTKIGRCVVQDGLQALQEKILVCDLLLLGSPVYVHQVSAQYKAFMDRLFIWIHTFKLLGKPVVTVLTTASTGAAPTERYLRDSAVMFGGIPVGSLRAIAYRPGEFPEREACRKKYLPLAKKISVMLAGTKAPRPVLMNHLMFMGMKWKIRGFTGSFEHGYWKDRGWFDLGYRKACRGEAGRRDARSEKISQMAKWQDK